MANFSVLSMIVFAPLLAALVLLLVPRNDRFARWWTLITSFIIFLGSLYLPFYFRGGQAGFQFETSHDWIASLNIRYHLGVDGISLWLVILATFLIPLCVLVSWRSIDTRVKEFFILLLLLESAMVGVFLALDMFLFYVFWEATLIPMALLIGVYGHGRRVYAAVKFFLYTMLASMFMLVAILWLYGQTGSFDFAFVQHAVRAGALANYSRAGEWLFLGFFIAFAVKVPLFPFHTWLPDAHVEAPTAGSVLLAAVLLKMGTYGLLRFNVGLFPIQARHHAPWIIVLAIIGIVYGALVTLVQTNLKKLLAYSSVSHLGFVVLGIFTLTQAGTDGAVYQMLNHGISTGALFILAGILYERRHTYEISEYGGLAARMPVLATFFLITALSSIGLPLLNGFVGEFLVLSGAFQARPFYGVISATAIIWSAAYMLWLYQRVFYGENANPANQTLADTTSRERTILWPLVLMMIIMGVGSPLWMAAIDPAVGRGLTDAMPNAVLQAVAP